MIQINIIQLSYYSLSLMSDLEFKIKMVDNIYNYLTTIQHKINLIIII